MKMASVGIRKVLSAVLALLVSAGLLAGCKGGNPAARAPGGQEKYPELGMLKTTDTRLTAWTVYWDTQRAVRSIMTYGDQLDGVSLFAAYYDENQVLFIPEKTLEISEKLKNYEKTAKIPQYLSVVNDKPDSPKDIPLLENRLGTAEKAEEHAKEIAGLAARHGFSGVEIDFEKIRDDLKLWEKFLVFEKALIAQCEEKGMKLRVVLETSTPIEHLRLPDGASYSVMCYNLYGKGTEPGPKADAEFLRKIVERFGDLPGISYALANGGFVFDGSGEAAQITGAEAAQLAADKNITPSRDKESGALTFSYGSDTVWYADGETLAFWQRVLRDAAGKAVDIDLWRI